MTPHDNRFRPPRSFPPHNTIPSPAYREAAQIMNEFASILKQHPQFPQIARLCALLHVRLLIYKLPEPYNNDHPDTKFWNEVTKEIENFIR